MITVDVRKASNEPGYLLSVTRRNDRGGGTTWPGPKCSSKKTADGVARWIESNLK